MNPIDFILNVAGVLLWLNWRSARLDPFTRATPATLAGTVRRAEPMRIKRWHLFAALAGLLFIRAYFYEHIGPAVNWTPRLSLTVVTLAFPLVLRGHVFFLSALIFSVLSFVRVLVIFHFWLLAVAMLNRRETNPDALQKLLLLQLGRPGKWPWWVQLLLPFFVITILWMLAHPLLVYIGVTIPVRSNALLMAQGAILSLLAYLSLKWLLAALLIANLAVTYVYLGSNPVWEFVNTTSRNLLSPLKNIPLRLGRVDLAPVIGIVLIVLLLHLLPNLVLHQLDRRNLTVWPQ
ncbi:MAG TPA: hypothetical protein VG938_15930 [Verrucomicrobiae bacterium]|nr:hypothetical protein [Verrucomicrobiae bacterium]